MVRVASRQGSPHRHHAGGEPYGSPNGGARLAYSRACSNADRPAFRVFRTSVSTGTPYASPRPGASASLHRARSPSASSRRLGRLAPMSSSQFLRTASCQTTCTWCSKGPARRRICVDAPSWQSSESNPSSGQNLGFRGLWQEGYYERVLRSDEATETVVRYVLDNPVRAGLVQRAEDYSFSGAMSWPGR